MKIKRKNPNAFVKGIYYENINNDVKQVNVDAELNFNSKSEPEANVLLDIYDNDKEKHFAINLDKNDINHLLQLPSVNKPIEQRLIDDFNISETFLEPDFSFKKSPKKYRKTPLPSKKYTHISSPIEEILLPLSGKKSSLKKRKKSSSSKRSKSSKRSSKRSRRNTNRSSIFFN
jgi:hypothetical protein